MKFLNNILAQAGLIVSGTTNLNGTSTAITVPSNDNSTNIATTAFVRSQGFLTGVTSGNVISALGYTPVSSARMITINGVSYDLSSDRSWSISAGLNARTEFEFTTTASQTVFTANYTIGQVDVFYNGSKLSASEFTANNGTSVTLAFAPPAGQLVEVVAWETGGGVSSGRSLTINGVTYDLSADRSWTIASGISGSGTSGYLSYWNGSSSVTGSSNLFWDNTNIRLGIGLINPQRRLEIYSANADSHLRLSGVAPSVSLGEAITGSIYQAKFGLATGNGQYAAGAVGGDFVIIAQTGSTIFSNGSSSLVKITSTGNLEVGYNGVSQNTHKLNVNGVINSANDVQAWGGQASFTANSMIFWNTNGIARFRAGQASTQLAMTIGSTDYLRMFTNGNMVLQSGGTFVDSGYRLDIQGSTRLTGALSGTSATFTNNAAALTLSNASDVWLRIARDSIFNHIGIDSVGAFYNTNANHTFYTNNGTTTALTIASTGAATFSNDVVVGGGAAISVADSNLAISNNSITASRALVFYSANSYNPRAWIKHVTTTGSQSLEFNSTYGSGTGSANFNFLGGNVGIGISAPTHLLTLYGTTQADIKFQNAGATRAYIWSNSAELAFNSLTSNPIKFFIDDTEKIRITAGGTLGIAGSQDVNNAILDKLSIGHLSGSYGWIQTWNATSLYLNKIGNAVYAGTQRIDNNSDQRIKENIAPIENALHVVLSLSGRKFNMMDENGKLRYGFVAQEVQPHLGDFVTESDRTFEKGKIKIENLLTLESSGAAWGALLVEAIKELKSQRDADRLEIESLKSQLGSN